LSRVVQNGILKDAEERRSGCAMDSRAIVVDCGSSQTKLGYSGDDLVYAIFPTVHG